ncbi:hypothetical protein [Lactococcus lactis]|uniref:hypothetical protein n=1 Tax=Lactococcus lactis TaxID=1358 RepID=UPI00345D3105
MNSSGGELALALTILVMIFSITWFLIKIGTKIGWYILKIIFSIFAWATMFPGTKYAK